MLVNHPAQRHCTGVLCSVPSRHIHETTVATPSATVDEGSCDDATSMLVMTRWNVSSNRGSANSLSRAATTLGSSVATADACMITPTALSTRFWLRPEGVAPPTTTAATIVAPSSRANSRKTSERAARCAWVAESGTVPAHKSAAHTTRLRMCSFGMAAAFPGCLSTRPASRSTGTMNPAAG